MYIMWLVNTCITTLKIIQQEGRDIMTSHIRQNNKDFNSIFPLNNRPIELTYEHKSLYLKVYQ